MELVLRPMSPEVLSDYLATTFDAYRIELIAAGRTPDEADENVAENVGRSFHDGAPINGNELFTVERDDQAVGVLWIAPRGPIGSWWIYDIELKAEFRGQGLGRATMLLAEAAVRERGGTELGLNVFGRNTTARGLYDSLGYEPTSIQMRKPL